MHTEKIVGGYQKKGFQLKTSFSPCMIFQLLTADIEILAQQLTMVNQNAPHYLQDAPLIIDLEKIDPMRMLDFTELKKLLQSCGWIPIGVRNGSHAQQEASTRVGLPLMAIGKTAFHPPTQKKNAVSSAQIVTHPVRSGMQVYAQENDLIVLSQISSGAEVMADGHKR